MKKASVARAGEIVQVMAALELEAPELPEGFFIRGSGKTSHETVYCSDLGSFPFPSLEEDDFKAPLLDPDGKKTVLIEKGRDKLRLFWKDVHNRKMRSVIDSLSGAYAGWHVRAARLCRAGKMNDPNAESLIDFMTFSHGETVPRAK